MGRCALVAAYAPVVRESDSMRNTADTTEMITHEPIEAEFKPNYDVKCMVCGQTPTVDIYVAGKLRTHLELCGPCCWGEANTLDPNSW